MSREPTQKEVVRSLLVNRGDAGFTAREAIYEHGITRAATYVHELRQEGWKIRTETKSGETARYILVEAPREVNVPFQQESLGW